MFSVNSLFTDTKLYSHECFITYDQVIEKDRILIDKHLKNIFSFQISKGAISPLNGGKSGDSLYIAKFETRKVVIRLMAENANKAFAKQLFYSQLAEQNQLGPAVLYHNLEDRIIITEFIEGIPLHPSELDDEKILFQLSRALHHIHHFEGSIWEEYKVFKIIELKLKNLIPKDVLNRLEKYLNSIQEIESAVRKRNLTFKPCHNDIHMTNVFYDHNQNIKFIDWGDAGLGDPFFDLARASIEFHLSKDQTEKFLKGYFSKDISSAVRAHFFLMQNLVILKIGLNFLDTTHINEDAKGMVISFFKKNEIKLNNPIITLKMLLILFSIFLKEEFFQKRLKKLC